MAAPTCHVMHLLMKTVVIQRLNKGTYSDAGYMRVKEGLLRRGSAKRRTKGERWSAGDGGVGGGSLRPCAGCKIVFC